MKSYFGKSEERRMYGKPYLDPWIPIRCSSKRPFGYQCDDQNSVVWLIWTSWCQVTWSMVWLRLRLFNVVALKKVKICFGSFDLFDILYCLYYQWQPPLLLRCIECSWVPRIELSFPLIPNSHFNSQVRIVPVPPHMLERDSCGLQQIPAVRLWVNLEWELKLGLSLWYQVLNLPPVLLSCTKMTWETIHSKASLLNVSHKKNSKMALIPVLFLSFSEHLSKRTQRWGWKSSVAERFAVKFGRLCQE